jgi:predicted ABC-type ATPase
MGLVARGYRLVIYAVPCPLEVAVARAEQRERHTGRHVPESLIRERHGRLAELLRHYAGIAHEMYEITGDANELVVRSFAAADGQRQP